MMIQREMTRELLEAAGEYPVVTIFGPRQSGKTILARMTFPDREYASLENPDTRVMAEQDPRGFLSGFPDGAVLDEIQRVPDLLSYLQEITDQKHKPGMFILTGSHQPELHQNVSQTLAGRTAVLTLLPFSFRELLNFTSTLDPFQLIVQGFYPRLHEQGLNHIRFFNSYLQTYVERDVRALINIRDLSAFQQFMTLLAGRVGQVVNASALSNDVGVTSTTIKNWISALKASFIVFELQPFHENIRKRVTRSPKIYFTDTGLAAFLLGIETPEQAFRDPLRGGLYENLVVQEVLKSALNRGRRPNLYFYRDTLGNEVDLIIKKGRELIPVEIKSAATFTPQFVKGIENFRHVAGPRCRPGIVLYNGGQDLTFKETRIVNPMLSHDLGIPPI
jgi:uncharacterized protein